MPTEKNSTETMQAPAPATRSATAEREVVITRIIDAPRELVFKLWTDPEHLMRWWAPLNCTTPYCTTDLRKGGVFHFCIRTADGQEAWGKGVYEEIVEPERIVYIDSFADDKGNTITAEEFGITSDLPTEARVTVTFEEYEGKTKLTLHHAISESIAADTGALQGWNQMLDRLAEELERTGPSGMLIELNDKEAVFTRTINAPRELVFKVWTEPEHFAQWWGPHTFTNTDCHIDLRPGGTYRITMNSPEGEKNPLKGTYLEIVEPERLVMTVDPADHPDSWHEILNQYRTDKENVKALVWTVSFEEIEGKTKLTIRSLFPSNEDRDAMIKLGMAEGLGESLEKLEAVTTTIQQQQENNNQ